MSGLNRGGGGGRRDGRRGRRRQMDGVKRRGADCGRPLLLRRRWLLTSHPSRPRQLRQSLNGSPPPRIIKAATAYARGAGACTCKRATGRINGELYYHLFPHMLLCFVVTHTSPSLALPFFKIIFFNNFLTASLSAFSLCACWKMAEGVIFTSRTTSPK